ncbi:HTH-type transcriptional activator RhaS [bioreactor metagenome]|uniref:HTH-type transcriptional activator RhaS n=1 Tax=bioreactor metagenome TaxID=1076179 RepID=A0A645J002_9ZZZZ
MLRQWFHQLPELHETGSIQTASRLLSVIWSRIGELERRNRDLEHHPALARAVTWLFRHYADPGGISELAARAGVSTSHLNLLFRRQFGIGPQRYLNELRLSRARQLLANPYWSIAEVAGKSGFPDPNYFSRKFRALYRQTPQECRRTLLSSGWVDHNPEKPGKAGSGGG